MSRAQLTLDVKFVLGLFEEPRNFKFAVDRRISPAFLEDDVSRGMYAWCLDFYSKFGDMPKLSDFSEAFTNVPPADEFPDLPKFEHTVSLLRERFIINTCSESILKISAKLKDYKGSEALPLFKHTWDVCQEKLGQHRLFDWTSGDDIEKRKREYRDRSSSSSIVGFSSPFKSIDRRTLGWQKQDLIGVFGRTGVGKTMFLLILAYHHWRYNGGRPLVCTFEMPASQLTLRLDAYYAGLPLQKLREGSLDSFGEASLFSALDALKNEPRFPILEDPDALVLSNLSAEVKKHDADMLLVDGAYLLEQEGEGYEKYKDKITALKQMARALEIPIVFSWRLTNQGTIAFYTGIDSDLDVRLDLIRGKDLRLAKRMLVKPKKYRMADIEGGEFLIDWDFDGVRFSEIEEGDDKAAYDLSEEDDTILPF